MGVVAGSRVLHGLRSTLGRSTQSRTDAALNKLRRGRTTQRGSSVESDLAFTMRYRIGIRSALSSPSC